MILGALFQRETHDQFGRFNDHSALLFGVHVMGGIKVVVPGKTLANGLFPLASLWNKSWERILNKS